MNHRLNTTFAIVLASALLPGCTGSTPPAEPVPPSTAVAAIDTPPPQYPLEQACAGIGGKTVLSVEIGPDGTPDQVRLVTSSGNEALDRQAEEAVRGWKFRPATRAGQPVAQGIQVPVTFTPPNERPAACFALDAGRSPVP